MKETGPHLPADRVDQKSSPCNCNQKCMCLLAQVSSATKLNRHAAVHPEYLRIPTYMSSNCYSTCPPKQGSDDLADLATPAPSTRQKTYSYSAQTHVHVAMNTHLHTLDCERNVRSNSGSTHRTTSPAVALVTCSCTQTLKDASVVPHMTTTAAATTKPTSHHTPTRYSHSPALNRYNNGPTRATRSSR